MEHDATSLGFAGVSGVGAASDLIEYASWGARAAAATIDMVVMQVGAMLIDAFFFTWLLGHMTPAGILVGSVGPLVLGGAFSLFYCVWLECSPWQATLGKRMLGLKVVDVHGRRISFATSSWRNMAKGLSVLTLGIGYLMPLWDHRGQALHDKAAGCLVIRARTASENASLARPARSAYAGRRYGVESQDDHRAVAGVQT